MAHLAHYRQAHPLPFVITHWINLISMILLIFTGFMIHFPFWAGLMGAVRGLHVCVGIIWVCNAIFRIICAFLVFSAPTGGTRNTVRDVRTWLPQADSRHQLGAWIKYYLFIKKDHPLGAKLGVPQKLAYLAIALLILIQAYCGFALWEPTSEWALFAFGTNLVGGAMSMRIIHYFIMFIFILFIMLHVYLVLIEGTTNAKNMLFRKEHNGLVYDPQRHVIVGEDNTIND